MPNAIEGDTSTASQVVSSRSGHLLAHVRDAGAGGGGGVELAHVVAGLVGAQLRELGARADAGRAVLARDDAAGAAHEGEVERLDERGRDRARALAAGRRRQGERSGASRRRRAHAASALPVDRAPVGLGHGLEHLLEQVVGARALAEALVAQHEPVAEHLGREVADVAREHVAAAAQQRERARRLHQADRPARRRAVAQQRLDVGEPVAVGAARGVGERDRVVDHLAVDDHVGGRLAEAQQVGDGQPLLDDAGGSSERFTTDASSPGDG